MTHYLMMTDRDTTREYLESVDTVRVYQQNMSGIYNCEINRPINIHI